MESGSVPCSLFPVPYASYEHTPGKGKIQEEGIRAVRVSKRGASE